MSRITHDVEDLVTKAFVINEDEVKSPLIVEDDEETVTASDEHEITAKEFIKTVLRAARHLPAYDTSVKTSLTRATAYCDNLHRMIVSGLESDAEGDQLSLTDLQVLDDIDEGIEVTKSKLTSAMFSRLEKKAGKSSHPLAVYTPFIFALARTCLNAKAYSGKNIEEVYKDISAKYKLSDRELLELRYALNDMGLPMYGSFVDGIDLPDNFYA